jgi:hypothetical protein
MNGMTILGWIVWSLAVFVGGFYVGKKNGQKAAEIEQRIRNVIGGKS